MSTSTVHNPDQYMADLRQILSQGRKRIGLLIGAGAPVALKVDENNCLCKNGEPLIPDVARITSKVLSELNSDQKKVISKLQSELGTSANIEDILTRIRSLSQVIGTVEVHGVDGSGYLLLAEEICAIIGKIVDRSLPVESNPYTELVSWIGGTQRDFPVEIFTPNYDLLIEEAFERFRLPYFDGFSGSYQPFFDPASITDEHLFPRWSRLWKLHGSLGWKVVDGRIVRTGNRESTSLIYPDHLKYDHISRQPYSALFERLRSFLTTPDTLLLSVGFSFSDAHITAILRESLVANPHTAILSFQHKNISQEGPAVSIALTCPNLSIYARDGAVIRGINGKWSLVSPPKEEWHEIRKTFWGFDKSSINKNFLLGDFEMLARFFAQARASTFGHDTEQRAAGILGDNLGSKNGAEELAVGDGNA